ncbi:MAG: MBL fold metallo-hydrolase [Acetobacteraceae bacterium]
MKRVIEGVHSMPICKAIAFLIDSQEELTLIDVGLPHQETAVFEVTRGVGRSPDELKHLIFTHHHLDQIAGAAALILGRAQTGLSAFGNDS